MLARQSPRNCCSRSPSRVPPSLVSRSDTSSSLLAPLLSASPAPVSRRQLCHQRRLLGRGGILGPAPSVPEAARAEGAAAEPAAAEAVKTVRVHYVRRDKRYQGWGLHIWGDVQEATDWQRPLWPVGFNQEDGVWWEVPLRPGARFLGMLVHAGESKSARAEVLVEELGHAGEVWLAGDEQHAFMGSAPDTSHLPVGTLSKQAATWVSGDVIAWRHDLVDYAGPRRFVLHASKPAHLWIDGTGVHGAEQTWELQPASNKLPPELAAKHPYLAGCSALRVPPEALQQVWSLLRGQLAVSVLDGAGVVLDATGVQLQGALDAHAFYEGPLGAFKDPGTQKLTVAVWAPTAQSVELLWFKSARGGQATPLPMQPNVLGPGVWSAELPDGALWTYYKYRVTVYCPWSQRVEVSEATDPYSRSLAADGDRSQVVLPDLLHPSLVPEGWHTHPVPSIKRWTDISLYELHIRDFSSQDETVKPELRGKYLAFVPEAAPAAGGTTSGLAHLASLREAGLNHLHLLPTYDGGSVPERAENQMQVEEDLSAYPPDSEAQQAAVLRVADHDAFNWLYDPVHYGVPDGSYATDPDGVARIVEFRRMVQALHLQGWRVVLDVVYNHTFASGPHSKYSVLDKIVPGYYHRRFEDGEMCHSTCCNNTATENAMCERLVVDDLVHWAKAYKIDGFRFDIMGHLLVSTLDKMRQGLDRLTLDKDGVDGKSIYIYGEAWDFGEVANNARGRNCGQFNLAGTSLGAFNDRMRDGALGGGPFAPHDFQGFVTGLALAPNGNRGQGDVAAQLNELVHLTDWVRYSLAGNLRQYVMETASGQVLSGETAQAHGLPLAYGAQPCEHISFIGCHDNLTMFDAITEKAALTVVAEERARMQLLCLALIILSQGIPFIHAGDDLLRSKSLDRDSYNSGDWFNGVDWTGKVHKLGVGLPVHTKNGGGWHYKRPLLSNALIKPTTQHILATSAAARQLLRVRYSSPLFRLPSAAAVCEQVRFHNTGPQQVPGVVVMEVVSAAAGVAGSSTLEEPGARDGSDVRLVHDPKLHRVVVVFNASPLEQVVPYPAAASHLHLHPLLSSPDAPDARARASRADDNSRLLSVPGRTTAVFVQPWSH